MLESKYSLTDQIARHLEVRRDRENDRSMLFLYGFTIVILAAVVIQGSSLHVLLKYGVCLEVFLLCLLWYTSFIHRRYPSFIRLNDDRIEVWTGGWKTEFMLSDIKSIEPRRFGLRVLGRYVIVSVDRSHMSVVLPEMLNMDLFVEDVNKVIARTSHENTDETPLLA